MINSFDDAPIEDPLEEAHNTVFPGQPDTPIDDASAEPT